MYPDDYNPVIVNGQPNWFKTLDCPPKYKRICPLSHREIGEHSVLVINNYHLFPNILIDYDYLQKQYEDMREMFSIREILEMQIAILYRDWKDASRYRGSWFTNGYM